MYHSKIVVNNSIANCFFLFWSQVVCQKHPVVFTSEGSEDVTANLLKWEWIKEATNSNYCQLFLCCWVLLPMESMMMAMINHLQKISNRFVLFMLKQLMVRPKIKRMQREHTGPMLTWLFWLTGWGLQLSSMIHNSKGSFKSLLLLWINYWQSVKMPRCCPES